MMSHLQSLSNSTIFGSPHKLPRVKALLGLFVVLMCLSSGCVAIPPLVTVNKESDFDDPALRRRVEDLERRVRDLEANNRPK